jgi:hypothetical protein
MFQTRERIHFTIAPDPGGNRAKRPAPRRVPSAPDLSIVFQTDSHRSHSRSLPDRVRIPGAERPRRGNTS